MRKQMENRSTNAWRARKQTPPSERGAGAFAHSLDHANANPTMIFHTSDIDKQKDTP